VVRQRPQEHRFNHAEDGRVGAHRERENEHGGDGESRAAAENPDGIAKVLEEWRHLELG
jgi:hypothetical protein